MNHLDVANCELMISNRKSSEIIEDNVVDTSSAITQVEAYGTSTVVFVPYFAVIQAGDLRPYF